jgi:hypothetical protein
MGREDDIGYAGPDLLYRPGPGANTATEKTSYLTPKQRSYADVDRLDKLLNFIVSDGSNLSASLELDLATYAMPIPRNDQRLMQAVQAEWPKDLGDPKDSVSYRLYRYLAVRKTTTAAYIRQRFEAAIRDYTGTHSLDLFILTGMLVDEAQLIQEFKATYIGTVNDKAEYRSIELFIDWAENGVQRLNDFRQMKATGGAITLPDDEVNVATAAEARNAQAMYKVKLNTANREVSNTIETLKTYFSDNAKTFYGRFLGPAMQFRLNVSRNIQPATGRMAMEAETTTNAMDMNLQVMQGDQMRRNQVFDQQVSSVLNSITRQNVYRNYINQLSSIGQTVTPGVPGTVTTQVEQDPVEVAFFDGSDTPPTAPVNDVSTLQALHGDLAGRDDLEAHDQYVLKSGGLLTGDLSLNDGVLIDGMRPGAHRHTGLDGTQLVHGSNIEPGTVSPVIIDRGQPPLPPTGLRVVSQTTRIAPPGMTVVDVQIAWDGDVNLTYEVQSVPLLP